MSSVFSFPACTFGISKYKESTARAVIFDIARGANVLTVECSFFGSNNPLKLFTPSLFLNFTSSLLKALKHYFSRDEERTAAEESLPQVLAEVAAMKNSQLRGKYSFKD